MIFPEEIKENFPIFKNHPDLVYLDSAATSQKPESVIRAITDFYTQSNANVHRGIYKLSEKSTEMYESARATVANFIGAGTNEIVFTSGTTEGANLIAESYLKAQIQSGDILISSVAEHHSNFLPMQRIAKQQDASLKLVGLDNNENFDYAEFESELRTHADKVKAVALSAISNVLGYKLDISKITKLVREFAPNAVIIIDAAQIVGHSQFSVTEEDIDFAIFSGHKMFAETGIGVLWGKASLLNIMPPYNVGGGMISTVEVGQTSYAEAPTRFEAGTPHISGAVSMKAAVEYIDQIGLGNIETHHKQLTRKLILGLSEIPQVKLMGTEHSGVVAFSIENIHPHDISQYLADDNIAVRAGHHCTQILHREEFSIGGSVRASVHIYNSLKDIEKLVVSLKKCINYYE